MTALASPLRPSARVAEGFVPLRLHDAAMPLYHSGFRGQDRAGAAGTARQKTALRTKYYMTQATDRTDAAHGIEGVLLANRARIVRFLEVRGAGDAAEDLFQDLWMRLTEKASGPIGEPLAYVMRAANNLMLDRYRSARQSALRDKAWGEAAAVQKPTAESALISREQLALVEAAIAATGERPARIFRRFRVDGMLQRDIAAEMGVSLSTVEADLRKVYAALAAVRRQFDAS
ncbi:RNA polymerase sigma-70 factor, ECF subfamily [Sphingopyxis indica]|uniref:RNA polymerase sigma-70 factor, ECF subfamily n=2 Tax=Sphingopyxis indica TaxID=436663 RepID=A0A239EHQ6_9SPHN|nr:RNA polymerase sigma-70 factor, ECF subfamily [Sphingopyxis indica]